MYDNIFANVIRYFTGRMHPLDDEAGAETAEYVLLIALIALLSVPLVRSFGPLMDAFFGVIQKF